MQDAPLGAADSVEAEVVRRALEVGLLAPGDRVLVAASGGADSTALAALLVAARGHGLPLEVVLGHVDHGWRGAAEAAADRRAVEALAARLGVPLAVAGPPDVVRRTEDDARRHRYAALARLAVGARCAKIATAHHLRDQAETFLMRLVRGSGPAGLAGIPARRPLGDGGLEVVRPVLDVAPARLREYLDARALAWRDDPTNAGLDRDRAAMRHRLVQAERRGCALSKDLATAASRFRRSVERHERDVSVRLSPSLRVHSLAAAVEVALEDARSLRAPDWATGLRALGRGIAADAEGPWFTRAHADLVARLVAEGVDGAAVDLPHGRRVLRSGRRLVLHDAATAPIEPVVLSGDSAASTGVGARRVTLGRRSVSAATFDIAAWIEGRHGGQTGIPAAAALCERRLGERITLRAAAPGDRFEPLGATSSAIGVGAFLGRQGLPGVLRRGALVVAAADGTVVWVVGHRIDRRLAVGPTSDRVAILTVDRH